MRAANTLAVGLLLVAALITAQHYPRAAGVADDATAAARAIAALSETTPVTLLDDGAGLSWDLPALRFALAGSHRSTGYLLVSGIADWPFQPGEVVLAPPRLRDALPALLARAPAAQVVVERDPVANPTLYRVQMP